MLPATSWEENSRAWTVMGRLRARQRTLRDEAKATRRRLAKKHRRRMASSQETSSATLAKMQQDYEDSVGATWRGGPFVLAFLFAHPDCDAMRMLDVRGEYFDYRTGDTWDLFFPGYYRSTKGSHFEAEAGARPVGRTFARDWYFHPREFNELRHHIERSSMGRWEYSGCTDLVLVNGYLSERGEPVIDWASTISGQVTDQATGTRTLTLAEVVERMTRDLEAALEDPTYGVGAVTQVSPPLQDHTTVRDFMVNALAGIAAALGARVIGI